MSSGPQQPEHSLSKPALQIHTLVQETVFLPVVQLVLNMRFLAFKFKFMFDFGAYQRCKATDRFKVRTGAIQVQVETQTVGRARALRC